MKFSFDVRLQRRDEILKIFLRRTRKRGGKHHRVAQFKILLRIKNLSNNYFLYTSVLNIYYNNYAYVNRICLPPSFIATFYEIMARFADYDVLYNSMMYQSDFDSEIRFKLNILAQALYSLESRNCYE